MKQRKIPLHWLILGCWAVIYAVMAAADRVWADEAYTFAMVRRSFPEIWRITAADVHPPLYYFAAKIFGAPFGYSQYSLRLFSGLLYLAVMAVGWSQLTRLFQRRVGLLFLLLFPLYPFALEYAVEVRMYSLGALAVFLNALFAYRCWRFDHPADWIGFTAAGLCAAYTHYFALVSAGIVYGLLLLCILIGNRKLLKPWLLASLATIVLYLPWLKCFVEQLAFKVSNEYWIEPITLNTLVNYALTLLHANGHSAFPAFFGLLVLALVIAAAVKKDAVPLLALAVPVLTMVLGVGVSLLIRPIFVIRYLACCGPLLVFFLAYGLGKLEQEQWIYAASAVLLVSFCGNFLFAALDLLPTQGRVDQDFPQADAYVVTAESALQISQVVTHYRPEVPIYAADTLGAASPYQNDHPLEEFFGTTPGTFLVITDEGSGPDGTLLNGRKAEYLGRYQAAFDTVEVFLVK